MQVIFLVQYKKYGPGEIHTLDFKEAEALIKKGIVSQIGAICS